LTVKQLLLNLLQEKNQFSTLLHFLFEFFLLLLFAKMNAQRNDY